MPAIATLTTSAMNRTFCALALAALFACSGWAADPESVLEIERETVEFAIEQQSRIDALDDETRRSFNEYRNELERIRDLEAYNDNLRKMIESQRQEQNRLEAALGDVEVVKRDIVPLMLEMSNVLTRLVEVDVPFLPDERKRRTQDVARTLTRADVALAEKYRRVIEAYLIEAEYGQNIEAWEGVVSSDGAETTVDFLRIGRVGLYYMTLDRDEVAIWDERQKVWLSLDPRYVDQLDLAIRVARRQAPPNLLTLPMLTGGSS